MKDKLVFVKWIRKSGVGKTFWVEVQQVQEPCSRHTLGVWRAERTQVSRSTMRERGDGGPAAGTRQRMEGRGW